MFACCGKKEKIIVTNLRSQPCRGFKMVINEKNVIATFDFDPDTFEYSLKRELTGEDREKQIAREKELQRLKEEEEYRQQKEDEEIARLQAQIEQQTFQIKEKKQLQDQFNELFQKLKREQLITQIKNELLKKMIVEEEENLKKNADYPFNNI